MDEKTAEKLVKETLEYSFNKENFIGLIKNILNEIDDKRTFICRGHTIYESFRDHIKTLERIGQYTDPEGKVLDVLITKLEKESSLERARSMQRNYISRYLESRSYKNGALVAFVSPNQEHWRFSFVKMEYGWGERGEIETKLTPARRYSFLVGETENSHTAKSRLLPLLMQDRNPTLEEIENAFSVETVTKEFFTKYRYLFHNLKEELDKISAKNKKVKTELESKNIRHSDFAKKLLGQIIFLYFLQKKGWFGVGKNQEWGTGSQHFLRKLFNKEHREYQNFFNDILEPLFYEALRVEHDDDYYFHFDCKIPFLNGGLFDPINNYDWKNIDILLPNELFSNNKNTKEGDTGDGILDIFDRYNFTVKEDEPLEKEVAVDPEMLGKVFENLLEVSDRQSKGTYYTPRMIVHYMCQESLINYLATELNENIEKRDIETLIRYGESTIEHESQIIKQNKETNTYTHRIPETIREHAGLIDQKLVKVHICDPAVGSGAFLVGMMSEIVKARNTLTPYLGNGEKRTLYFFKRQAIEKCLYGVDIELGAIEIAKLRLWLSLVVDEEDRQTIQPLPNLDYKIIKGDSLLVIKKDIMTNNQFNQIEDLKADHFNETQISKKQSYKKEIDQLLNKLTNNGKKFDLEIYFSEVFKVGENFERKGFDIVIANPPYIQLQKNSGELADCYKPFQYKVFDRSGDIYMLFYEKGLRILKQKGILCFITSNKWMRVKSGKKLRDCFHRDTQVLTLLDMGADVFNEVTVDTNILLTQKIRANSSNNFSFKAIKIKPAELEKYNNLSEYMEKKSIDISLPKTESPWAIITLDEQVLKNKIEKIGIPLGEWDRSINIKRGIITGYGKAFIINNQTKEKLIKEDPKSINILKPIVRGKNVYRYYVKWNGEWLIDAHNGYAHTERIKIQEYPAIKKYLDQYWTKIQRRQDQGNTPYNLRNCAYHTEFEKEKIVWTAVNSEYRCAILPENFYLNNSLFMITGDYIKFICAYINSKLCRKYLEWILSDEDSYNYGRKEIFQALPISRITEDNKGKFVQVGRLVDEILNSHPKSNIVQQHENQINQLIYKLYHLTSEEIKIVEENME